MSKPAVLGRQKISKALQGIFFLAYPLIVYFAYTRLETRTLAILLFALYAISIAIRFRGSAAEIWLVLRQHIGLAILIAIALATGNSTVLLFMPVIVSLYLLWTFSASLRSGIPMIERFARIVEDDLPDFTIPYCRKVTIVWCAFLAANALCVLILALAAPLEWWALYSGLISYLLIGTIFLGELLVHKIWFRYFGDGPLDRTLSRLFPPEHTENGRRSLAYQAQRERGEATTTSA
ncbi:MAG: hypothetical protein JRD03_02065 [Deltaproteobacteria bacterium]|nr:hypothetical protein [Deltaproteobacteria bacterium]